MFQSLKAKSKKFSIFLEESFGANSALTCVHDWRHVPSALNPVNLASRGCTADVLTSDKAWFYGPNVLKKLASDWPQQFDAKLNDNNSYRVYNLENKDSVLMLIDVTSPGLPLACDKLIAHFLSLYRMMCNCVVVAIQSLFVESR